MTEQMRHYLQPAVFSRLCGVVLCCLAAGCLAGCGSLRESFPERTATEQLLMSTAADRAVSELTGDVLRNKRIYIVQNYMAGYDKEYMLLALRRRLLGMGAAISEEKKDAELIVEVATGALSVDYRKGLIGLPAIPIPIPFIATPLSTPELAIFKNVQHTGRAKVLLTCRNAKSGAVYHHFPILNGTAIMRERWYCLLGPFRSSDLDEPMSTAAEKN